MMEEVDNIIIHSLRQIGCNIHERITNLSSFNTELVIEATIKCLEIIRPSIAIYQVIPTNMAARFRLGADLAQVCSELGYRGDIGYQTFLYSSETDLRRVFIFLIEKLPKESDKGISETISKFDELEKAVTTILFKQLNTSWLPHYCRKKPNGTQTWMPYESTELYVPLLDEQKEFEEYYTKHELSVLNQLETHELSLSSVISFNAQISQYKSPNVLNNLEWLNNQPRYKMVGSNESVHNSENLRLMSRFSLNERLQQPLLDFEESYENNSEVHDKKQKESLISSKITQVRTKEDIHNLEIERLKENCDQLRININSCQSEMKELTIQHSQFTVSHQEEEGELRDLKDCRRIKARTCSLLNDGENNIKKLISAIESEKNKLINLATQWEQYRAPLIKKYRDEREKYSAKANTSQKKLDELRLMRDKNRELSDECQIKDQQYSQLLVEIQKQSKEVNRTAYTQRILEIINNVRKQKAEIDKVLGDTREIQKEINMLSGKLERSFTVVDELIFRDAKTNEASRRAYKLLATLHSDCSELVTLVEETGTTLREIRDLEEQVDSESTKNIEANLQRITADLDQMRQETASLMAQLASKSS